MKKSLTALLAVAALSTFAGAPTVSEKDKLAEELVNLAGISQNIANAKKNIMQMNDSMLSRMGNNCDAEKLIDYRKKIDKLVNDSFDWSKVKGEYVKLYANTFTADEMKGIIEFYKTPAGKLLRERESLARQEMQLMQNQYRKIMPQLRQMQMELRGNDAAKRPDIRKRAPRNIPVKKTECSKDKAACSKTIAPATTAAPVVKAECSNAKPACGETAVPATTAAPVVKPEETKK